MTPGLTCVGYGWSVLSLIAMAAVCTGYYMPYWLRGAVITKEPGEASKTLSHVVHFGCFRRCNYWSTSGMREGCGRYTDFTDIPSVWWQVCTVVVGVGCALSALIAFVSVPACCTSDVISRTSGRILGVFQLIAAILICFGCALFPMGWDNREVKEACGEKVGKFILGGCSIGWSYYVILGGACLLFVCASLSTIAGRPIQWRRIKTDSSELDKPVAI